MQMVGIDISVLGIAPILFSLLSHEERQIRSFSTIAMCGAYEIIAILVVLAVGDANVKSYVRALMEPGCDGIS